MFIWGGSLFLCVFFLVGGHWASWFWMYTCLPRFGNFSAIISLNKLSVPLFFSFPFGTVKMCLLVHPMEPRKSFTLSSLFPLFLVFFVVVAGGGVVSLRGWFLVTCVLICWLSNSYSSSNLLWNLSSEFFSSVTVCLVPWSIIFVYYYLNIFCIIVKNFMHCFSTFVEHPSDHYFEFLVGTLCISDSLGLSLKIYFVALLGTNYPVFLFFFTLYVVICTLGKSCSSTNLQGLAS